MSKKNSIRNILQNADEKAVERIAEGYLSSDKKTGERLYKRCIHNLSIKKISVDSDNSDIVSTSVSTRKIIWFRRISTAAALLIVICSISGGIFLLNKHETALPDSNPIVIRETDPSDIYTESAPSPKTAIVTTAVSTATAEADTTTVTATSAKSTAATDSTAQIHSTTITSAVTTNAARTETTSAPHSTSESTAATTASVPLTTEKEGITTTTTMPPENPSELTEEQIRQLEELREKGEKLYGFFIREEMIIKGEIPYDSPRFSLNKVKTIISESSSPEEITDKILNSGVYPDFVEGSGVTLIEYWLSNDGSSKILIILESHIIRYIDINDNEKSETLYSIYS